MMVLHWLLLLERAGRWPRPIKRLLAIVSTSPSPPHWRQVPWWKVALGCGLIVSTLLCAACRGTSTATGPTPASIRRLSGHMSAGWRCFLYWAVFSGFSTDVRSCKRTHRFSRLTSRVVLILLRTATAPIVPAARPISSQSLSTEKAVTRK
jgi:hypothetical protein